MPPKAPNKPVVQPEPKLVQITIPLRNPPLQTVMGGSRQASPAFSRFWGWMSLNRSGLGSWSTDECVDNAWGRLVELRAALADLAAKGPPPGDEHATKDQLESMLGQLDIVMRRGTKHRITDENVTKATATKKLDVDDVL